MAGDLEPRRVLDVAVPDDGPAEVDLFLSESARRRIRNAKSPETWRAYNRQWREFVAWCARHGRRPLPATAETLATYVDDLADEGLAPATLEQAIATVRTAHTMRGHRGEPPTGDALDVLKGYRKERVENGLRNQRQSPPVTIDALRAMIGACDLGTVKGLRDRLMLVLGLALMGRRSELVGLTVDDVRVVPDGLEVTIRASKTDKDAKGETVAVPAGAHPVTNPVEAFADWAACLAENGVVGGRLLRSVNRHGTIGESLSASSVNTTLKDLAAAAELPHAERYTAHSLRAGGATVAYAAGVPVSVIARHGRWDPKSPVVLRYIRAVDRWKDNAMRNVGL